jgi:hypothetical protein
MVSGLLQRSAFLCDRSALFDPLWNVVGEQRHDFDPDNTGPVGAGGFVRRVARTPHYDGVKKTATEPCRHRPVWVGTCRPQTCRPEATAIGSCSWGRWRCGAKRFMTLSYLPGPQALSLLASIGSLRRRTPVAAKIALATAGASADVPGSPMPPGASLL